MKFSERYGHKSARQAIQLESMDADLRTSLWNVLRLYIWNHIAYASGGYYLSATGNSELNVFCTDLWCDYFKISLDELDDDFDVTIEVLNKYFFSCQWYEVYDFIEFSVEHFPFPPKHEFVKSINDVLKRELSGYRLVNGSIVKITDQVELKEIDSALDESKGSVRTHLNRALELLSDRKDPDYRNSIKESISAVESLVQETLGARGTLGQLVKKLEDEINLHPALAGAFGKLYGYTSDAEGIRHALLETDKLSFEDAKFFLVVCSAFVNFVQARIAKKPIV